jgi:hypothetical protein
MTLFVAVAEFNGGLFVAAGAFSAFPISIGKSFSSFEVLFSRFSFSAVHHLDRKAFQNVGNQVLVIHFIEASDFVLAPLVSLLLPTSWPLSELPCV